MITIETVLDVVPVMSLAIALIYYAMTINSQNKTRQAQLFMRLFETYIAKEWWRDGWDLLQMEWTDVDDFFQKYDSSVDLENFEKRYRLWSYLDGMGMLLKKGLIDKEMIYYLMGGYGAYWNWEKFKDVIKESRVRMNSPDHFVMFEYLAEAMQKIKLKKKHSLEIPSSWGILTQ